MAGRLTGGTVSQVLKGVGLGNEQGRKGHAEGVWTGDRCTHQDL